MIRTSDIIRRLVLPALVILCSVSSALALDVQARPTGFLVSWDRVDGAEWYDLYVDNGFVARLENDVFSYEIGNLMSNTGYDISFAARDGENNTLDAQFAKGTTTTWEGTYVWTNPTKKDNKGKIRRLVFNVRTVLDPTYGQHQEIYILSDDGAEHRIFPLYGFDDTSAGWTDYDADTEPAATYRLNAERFNTSSIVPSSWRVSKIFLGLDHIEVTVDTKAFGITLDTEVIYDFAVDEDGVRNLVFRMDGPSLVRAFVFFNPDGTRDDGAYVLKNQEDTQG